MASKKQILIRKIIFFLSFVLIFKQGFSQIILENGYYLNISENKTIPFSHIIISNRIISQIIEANKNLSHLNLDTYSNYSVIDLSNQYLMPGLIDVFMHDLPPEPSYLARTGVSRVAVLGGINPGRGELPRQFAYFHFPKISEKDQSGSILYSGPRIIFKKRLDSDSDLITSIRNLSDDYEVRDQGALEELFKKWGFDEPSLLYIDMMGFPMDLLNLLLIEARKRQLKIIGYAETSQEALDSIEKGAELIALNLGSGINKEELQTLAKRKIPIITTLSIYRNYSKALRLEDEGETFYQIAKDNLKLYLNAGGKVLMGGSYGAPWTTPGPPLDEIAVYKELDIDNATILEILTLYPIKLLGLKLSGRITPNYSANLIVTTENPLEKIDTLSEVKLVIHNGKVIHSLNTPSHVEVDLAYSKYFTRKEMLVGLWLPLMDDMNSSHLTLAPIFDGVLMDDGLSYFEFGLFTRFLIPSSLGEYHDFEIKTGVVFYDQTLFRLGIDYLHFFTPRLGLGFTSSVFPESHYIVGAHFSWQRIPYLAPGSKQWFNFNSYFNYEDYVVEETRLFTVRTESNFDLYDFLPPLFRTLNLTLGLNGGFNLNRDGKYFEQSFYFDLGISVWRNVLWQKNLWGDPLTRFRFQEEDGHLNTMAISLGKNRPYDKKKFNNTIIGWLTEIEYHFVSFSIFDLKGGLFWEMQKLDSNFSQLFIWNDQWIMDFGSNITLSIFGVGFLIGTYAPVNYQGKVGLPVLYGGVTFDNYSFDF